MWRLRLESSLVFLEDKLEQGKEDLVEPYKEDVHDEVVRLVSLHQR